MKRMIATIVCLGVLFSFVGCSAEPPKEMHTNQSVIEPDVIDITENNVVITDFAVRLFQSTLHEEDNTLISPVSVLSALGMIANGADGDTLTEIEDMIGLPVEDLNSYIYSYNDHLSSLAKISGESNDICLANSIWINADKDVTVHDSFLQVNESYYDTTIYQTKFNKTCVKTINDWVSENTQGLITDVLDSISKDKVLYLINTLAYEGEWEEPYEDVQEDYFESIDGEEQLAEFMYANEYFYLEDEEAVGFMKYYKGQKYAFAALLPNEDIDIKEYVNGLSGEELHEILSRPVRRRVDTSMPKFKSEYNTEMSEILKSMGMVSAFDTEQADFSNLGPGSEGEIYLDDILHKTYIDVNEDGTTAAAVTAVGAAETEGKPPFYKVYLNRPFVYILMDCENHIPLFMGTVMSVE